MRLRSIIAAVLLLSVFTGASAALAQQPAPPTTALGTPLVRFATFNASVNRGAAGALLADLQAPNADTVSARQLKAVAEIIQRLNPDVLLVNEFDYYENYAAADLFRQNFLEVSQNGQTPVVYPYAFVAPSNTGIPSGFDLDNNGSVGGGNDAFGFGLFPGQFGMAVFSKYPIQMDQVRTFQTFLWKDMPGARLPDDPATPAPADWYSPAELAIFRLSSKSHWDVPIMIGGQTVHALVSHPTPPVFDGPEDRNGTRNFDEIRLWADYVTPGKGDYLYDDQGRTGGLKLGSRFVIMGDQNSDPLDGDSIPGSIQQLLDNPLVNTTVTPTSEGGPQQAELQGRANLTHRSDPAFDTADFADGAPGNLRADYVLPSANIRMVDAQVFWPLDSEPTFPLVGLFNPALLNGFPSSDHRAVWADLDLIPTARPLLETQNVYDLDLDDPLFPPRARQGDADDPAIWVHPERPERSTVIGVLKDGGLDVYDLQGRVLQSITSEPGKDELRYNNVDLAYEVELPRKGDDKGKRDDKGKLEEFDLVAVTDRRNDLMVFFKVDEKSRKLVNVTAPGLPRVFTAGDDAALDDQTTAYGIALWRADDDEVYVFVSKRSSNEVAQLKLFQTGGKVAWEKVRTISFPLVDDDPEESQVEGMVVDQERGIVYMGQEQLGIWRAGAKPGDATVCPGPGCTLIDAVFPAGTNLKADVEGLTIYYGDDGKGYLLASSQGDNTFVVYDRKSNAYLGSFRVGENRRIDSVQESDGADVVNVALGRSFPKGLLVVQDGNNDPALLVEDDGELENVNSNFKFVPWQEVAKGFDPPLLIDTESYEPRD